MLIAVLLTLVFTMFFVGSIDTNHYMFDEDNGIWYFAPALCLPAICITGYWIRSKLEVARREKQQRNIAELSREIQKCEGEIQALRLQLQNNVAIARLMILLDGCGGDVSEYANHPKVRNIAKLTDKIDEKSHRVLELKEKISDCGL